MAPLLHTAVLVSTAFARFAASLKIEDVFDVYMEDAPGTCKGYYDPHKSDSIIEQWWEQANELNTLGLKTINEFEGKDNEATRFMAQSMFAIKTDGTGKEPPAGTGDAQRLDIVKSRFKDMQDFMNRPEKTGERIKIFCDSTYRKIQKPDFPLMDLTTGKRIPKDPRRPKGLFKTVGEKEGRRAFEDNWIFYYDVPGIPGGKPDRERAYVKTPKPPSMRNLAAPYPIDFESGEPSVCKAGRSGENYATRTSRKDGRSDHIVLCADYIYNTMTFWPQDFGSILHQKDLTIRNARLKSLTFYHELWHLVFPDRSPDAPMLSILSKLPQADAHGYDWGNVHGEAPHFYKWPQDCRSWGYLPGRLTAEGFKLSNSLALFDQCQGGKILEYFEPRNDWRMQPHAMAVQAPENYVWYAVGVWLNAKTGYQWNAGRPQKKGSAYEGMVSLQKPEYPPEDFLVKYGNGKILPAAV